MVRTSKTQKQKELSSSPVKPRFNKRLLERVGERAKAKLSALKKTAIALGIGVMVSCSPATLNAQDTSPKRSPKEPASAVEKSEVTYETFSDPEELEPYFKNAEGKFVNFKLGEQKKIGPYLVSVDKSGSGVDFEVRADDSKETFGVALVAPLPEVNVLVIDVPESNPYIKGKLIVFADSGTVYFQYFNKKENRHETRGVPLEKARMREGPIRTGFGVDDTGIFVINAPKDLRAGDVVCQATLEKNGDSWGAAFKFVPPAGKPDTVAMR